MRLGRFPWKTYERVLPHTPVSQRVSWFYALRARRYDRRAEKVRVR